MITIKVWEDPETGDRRFEGIVPRKSLMNIKLDHIDRLVLSSPEYSAADILQSLQLLAFREQQQFGELPIESEE